MTAALVIGALVVGLAVLTYASDHFVAGASRLAEVAQLSPVVVGAVVLGFGTSAPEMVTSALAAFQGSEDLGAGNIIGSNVANLSLGLGVAALLTPIGFSYEVRRRTIPLALGSMALFTVLISFEGGLSFVDGLVLSVALVGSLYYIVRTARPNGDLAEPAVLPSDGVPAGGSVRRQVVLSLLRSVLGLGGVVGGAQMAVKSAEWLADQLNLSGGFIGFTVVAVGTSLPELATVAAAAKRNETQLIVGNLFGSNLFNSLAVGGAMGLVARETHIGHNELLLYGLPAMWLVALVAVLAGIGGRQVKRGTGVVLLALGVVAAVVVSQA